MADDDDGWLMDSLEAASRRAAQLPKWARDIDDAHAAQYNPKRRAPESAPTPPNRSPQMADTPDSTSARAPAKCLSPSDCDYASQGWCPRCEPAAPATPPSDETPPVRARDGSKLTKAERAEFDDANRPFRRKLVDTGGPTAEDEAIATCQANIDYCDTMCGVRRALESIVPDLTARVAGCGHDCACPSALHHEIVALLAEWNAPIPRRMTAQTVMRELDDILDRSIERATPPSPKGTGTAPTPRESRTVAGELPGVGAAPKLVTHCHDCDRPEVCDIITRGTGPCGLNAGMGPSASLCRPPAGPPPTQEPSMSDRAGLVLLFLALVLIGLGVARGGQEEVRLHKEECHADLMLLRTPQDSIAYLRRHECKP